MPLACRELGEPEVLRLEEVARAPLKAGEVRVKVQAAGLNYPDILTVAGTYQHKPDLPGEGVTKFTVGDKVMFGSRLNAYAQEIALAATQCKPLPLQFSYAEGAGFGTGHALSSALRRNRVRSCLCMARAAALDLRRSRSARSSARR